LFITFKPYNVKYIDSCIMGALYVEKKTKKKFSWKTFAQKKTFFSIRWTWQQKLDWGFCEVHIWSIILLCYNLIYRIGFFCWEYKEKHQEQQQKKFCSSHRNIKHSALKIAFMESEWNRQKETCSNMIFNFSISSIYNFQFCVLFFLLFCLAIGFGTHVFLFI